MFDFVGRRKWYYILSLLVLVPGAISLAIPPALKPGIEFSSGTSFTVRFAREVGQEDMRNAMSDLDHGEARIQRTGENKYLVRTRELAGAAQTPEVGPAPPSERDTIEEGLRSRFEGFLDNEGKPTNTFIEFASVSGTVSREIGRNSAIAVAVAAAAILLYISFAFRAVPKPFLYGTAAIIATMHDALVVVGVFSIFGKVFDTEINTMFLTGLLTVIGFSVHDTIVVFDRIRENMARRVPGETFAETVNGSLNQTLARSLNTSLTVVLVLVAMLLLGGVTIRDFLLVLLIGIVSGTYSSIFVASQLLVTWEEGDIPRFFRRVLRRPEPVPVEA